MSKSTTLLAALLSVLSFGVVTSAASATPVIGAPGTAGPFSITSTVTGLNHTYNIGGAVFTCNTVTFASASNPMVGLGSPSNAVTFKPQFANCSMAISGQSCEATMTTNDTWTLTATSLKSGTAGTNGAIYRTGLTLNGSPSNPNTVIRMGAADCGLACTISLQAQSVSAAGTSNLALTNGGTSFVRLTGGFNSVAYTSSGCPGIPAVGSNWTYSIPASGTVFVPGAYVTGV